MASEDTGSGSYWPLKSMPLQNVTSVAPVEPSTLMARSQSQVPPTNLPDGMRRLSRDEARHGLLLEAGALRKAVPMVKKAVETLETELEATKTITAAAEGKITDVMEVPDHGARQAAIGRTFELFDAVRPRGVDDGPHGVTVNLIWPGWSSPPAEVVDATIVKPA